MFLIKINFLVFLIFLNANCKSIKRLNSRSVDLYIQITALIVESQSLSDLPNVKCKLGKLQMTLMILTFMINSEFKQDRIKHEYFYLASIS